MLKKIFHPATIISTFFWVGKLPWMPGTFGSLIAFPLWYLIILIATLRGYGGYIAGNFEILNYSLFLTAILFIIGVWAADEYEKISGKEDPGEVIIDEVVAQLLVISLSIYFLPYLFSKEIESFQSLKLNSSFILNMILFLNFLYFRIFDILKPWPINLVEKKFKGGMGVMLDDIVAVPFAVILTFCTSEVILELVLRSYQ